MPDRRDEGDESARTRTGHPFITSCMLDRRHGSSGPGSLSRARLSRARTAESGTYFGTRKRAVRATCGKRIIRVSCSGRDLPAAIWRREAGELSRWQLCERHRFVGVDDDQEPLRRGGVLRPHCHLELAHLDVGHIERPPAQVEQTSARARASSPCSSGLLVRNCSSRQLVRR
jgi:hypothetical protein